MDRVIRDCMRKIFLVLGEDIDHLRRADIDRQLHTLLRLAKALAALESTADN